MVVTTTVKEKILFNPIIQKIKFLKIDADPPKNLHFIIHYEHNLFFLDSKSSMVACRFSTKIPVDTKFQKLSNFRHNIKL